MDISFPGPVSSVLWLAHKSLVCKLDSVNKGQEEMYMKSKEEAEQFRLIGDMFNKQRNLYVRLILGSCKMSRSLHLPSRILRGYVEAVNGFSHIFSPGGLNNTLLSQGYVLGNSSHCRNNGQSVHSKNRGKGEGPLIAWILLKTQPVVISFWWLLQE